MGMPDAGDDFGAVGFDFHSPTAAVPLLAPPKFTVDGVERNGHSCREAGQGRDETFAVRLAGGFKTQHETRMFIVTDSNIFLVLRV
jgi:hypothetical protein